LVAKELGVASRQRTFSHFFFNKEILDQKEHDLSSPTHPTPVSPIEDKTESCHFDTTEMMEAESQAVLKALTEHNFQDAFKKW
jgi:hypothetical protein